MRLLLNFSLVVLVLHCVLNYKAFAQDVDRVRTGGPAWGPWGEWSACSRTCGGGVYYQERTCFTVRNVPLRSDKCDGPARNYRSCNIQDCPEGSKDFREEQCASFNEVPHGGILYNWVPFLGAPSQHCQLNCMPKGETFYYTQADMVVDGTRCRPESLDICVAGVCQKVGCDMMLNSSVELDKCGECGGDNSTCTTISGEFTTKSLQIGGYNDIVTLPVGATSITVKELAYSGNYLALRSVQGDYYINGDYRVTYPQTFPAAGTTFHYERHGGGELGTTEVFHSLGPLTEAAVVMLLTQGPNTGVSYEYSVPVGFQQGDPFIWSVGSYEDCSVECGGGVKHREVYCTRSVNSEVVADFYCSNAVKPHTNTSCNIDLCPPSWHMGDWSECPMTCAGDGIMQQRNVVCMRQTGRNGLEEADPSECLRVSGAEPDHFQLCNEDIPCPRWHTGEWSKCSEPCGPGIQTRSVSCGHINDVGDFECDEADKPPAEQICVERPCSDLKWMVASDWTKCSGSCGEAMQSREVMCVDSVGKVYPESACANITKPKVMQDCDMKKNRCKPQWVSTDWTECSASCGKGVRSRFVFCAFRKKNRWVEVPVKRCKGGVKPEIMESCGDKPCESGSWMTGDWSECSTSCGRGKEERSVMCFLNSAVIDDEVCKRGSRPNHVRRCLMDVPCPDDGSGSTIEPSSLAPEIDEGSTASPVTEGVWSDFCSMEYDTGPCRNFQVYWYYNTKYSQCHRFWYGGCDGNDNRFSTQIACEAACVEDHAKLTQEELCSLPKDAGPCRGNYPSYFYNIETQSCESFIFGGCQGNQNRFSGVEDCEIICGTYGKDPCSLPVDSGRCQESHDMWYYEIYSDQCLPFAYSGCFGNPNRFASKRDCENRCVQYPAPTSPNILEGGINVCALPAESGECRGRILKWFYNKETRLCESFTYSGCHGNENNFETQDKCLQTCSSGVHVIYPETTTVKSTTLSGPEVTSRISFTLPPTKQAHLSTDASETQVVLYTSPFASIRPRTKCESEREESSVRGSIGQFIPRCTEEGLYQRLQCHGSTGFCFCVNETTGARFEESSTRFEEPNCDDLYYRDASQIGTSIETVTQGPQEDEAQVPTEVLAHTSPIASTSVVVRTIPCSESEFGCCPNGVDKAEGNRYLNCPDVEPPRIISEVADSVSVAANSNFRVVCEASGIPRPTVHWTKNGVKVSDLRGKRYSDREGKLRIRNIVASDAGEYRCIADNGVGLEASVGMTLRVVEPEIETVRQETKVTVHEGEDVNLECKSAQDFEVSIEWHQGNGELILNEDQFTQMDDNTLRIESVQLSDAGSYVCTGRIGHSVIMQKYFNLVVEADVNIVSPPQDKQATTGDLVEFICDSTGSPTPATEWFLNGVKIVETSRVDIGPLGSLTINGVKLSDSGNYTCFVSNSISQQQASASLVVLGGSDTIDPECIDQPEIADCKLILYALLCHTEFGDYCCRTCRDNGY